MAGQLKIGGNVIATHAGTEGAGTVTLDSSTLTIGSNTTVTMGAGSIGTAVTMSANQPAVKTAINASGDAPIYACRAWVNFNGTGTVAIRSSGNVSSITDHGTGEYTVNFTNSMPDGNYATTQMAGNDADSATSWTAIFGANASRATTGVRFRTISVAASGNSVDTPVINIACFR